MAYTYYMEVQNMLKPIDLLVGLKIVTSDVNWTQMGVASELCLSSSQVNSAIKQLLDSGLLAKVNDKPFPVLAAIEEFIIFGMKYCFPAKLGALTVGVPTAYAAEPLSQQIMPGNDPIPVWPYADGKKRGVAIEPLHKNVPKSLALSPDENLQEILILIDALRIGRARERNLATEFLRKKFKEIGASNQKVTPRA